MIIKDFSHIFRKADCLKNYFSNLDYGEDAALSVASSARAMLIAANFINKPQCSLVIVPGKKNAQNFAGELSAYIGRDNVLFYDEPVFGEDEASTCPQRLMSVYALHNCKEKVVIAPSSALLRKVPDATFDYCKPIELVPGNDYDYEELLENLVFMGYKKLDQVDGPGTFSAKGGTIDIYLAQSKMAVRLDFFGDELEEIKRIVLSTGQAISQLECVQIFACKNDIYSDADVKDAMINLEPQTRVNKQIRELVEKLEAKISFVEIEYLEPYLYKKLLPFSEIVHNDVVVYNNEPRAILDDMQHFWEDLPAKFSGTSIREEALYCKPGQLNFSRNQNVDYFSLMQIGMANADKLKLKRPKKHKNIDELVELLHFHIKMGFTAVLSVPNSNARKNISMDVVERGLSIQNVSGFDKVNSLRKKLVNITDMAFPMSFIVPDAKMLVISLNNNPLYASHINKNSKYGSSQFFDVTQITFPFKPGDYVVHAHYGIALFRDIVKRKMGDSERDFLQLEYDAGDKLFVPIEQFGRVTKYVGPQGRQPKVTRLGTADWSHVMSKAKKASRKMAFDLVDIYSRRELAKGHAFPEDSERLRRMEQDFPYMETVDQARAIADVKQDMQSSRPMDRLICGDVGFGKTEVALRAAFKCVDGGMQVMFLCPTTILAQQHYTTFTQRLDFYNIRTNVLSRFKTAAESKQIIQDFKKGKLDILIGTHRLLSRDVCPKNLGLIIIDEEQRFGVGHKEQLKNFREFVDVLTLSATPIPRTMQMASSGVRDMSLILTPPDNRKSVNVHVGEWDIDLISDAIRRELARKGQIYYISNRVKSIKDAVERVGEAAGEARVGFAHGRMKKSQLESVMEDFSAGKIDVLVSTTIIENGIDNPNTNTLIIEDAQNFGLSQMYQLKGRVGRSVSQAYAYFLFSDQAMLNKDAVQRLSAIDEFSDLGSGMQIALRDLEIRGAGSFLGTEQSGNISHVGFDLFAQMLKVAVEKAQNQQGEDQTSFNDVDLEKNSISDVLVNIPGSAYIADSDIADIENRVLWYRRFAGAQSLEELYALEEAMFLEYKEPSDMCINFILKLKIAAIAALYGLKIVTVVGDKLFLEGAKLDFEQARAVRKIGGHNISQFKKITFPARLVWGDSRENMFDSVFVFLEGIRDIFRID